MTHDTDKFIGYVKQYIADIEICNILELGSRDGYQAIELSNHYPLANIYSFECNTSSIPIINNNIANYSKIHLYPYAVHNINGTIDFFPCTSNIGASSIFPKSGQYDYIENYIQSHTKVQCVRLDTFVEQNNIPGIDLIFADLQGAELFALEGLGKYLSGVKAMQIEVEYKEMYKNQPLYDQIVMFLQHNNFIELDKFSYHDNFWGEAIFLNKNTISNHVKDQRIQTTLYNFNNYYC